MQYTKKEITKLKKKWNEGIVVKDMAKSFPNRSVSSITAKLYALRRSGEIDGRTTKTRKETKTINDSLEDMVEQQTNPYEYYKSWVTQNKPLGSYPSKTNVKQSETSSMKIIKTLEEIRLFLIKKNEQYGDSALEPIRIFSKADKSEQLKVRIDDKLNRLVQGNEDIESDEDVVKDLIGYLVLLLIQMQENQ